MLTLRCLQIGEFLTAVTVKYYNEGQNTFVEIKSMLTDIIEQ